MGRYFYGKKNTVSDYKTISAKKLKAWKYFAQGTVCGALTWSWNGERAGSIGVFINISGREGTMRLSYTYDKTENMDYTVRLVSTPCHFGGVRWWFLCPLYRNGISCNRRVGVLYLGKYAGCRHCYDLTYESCQESHKYDFLTQKMGLPNTTALKRALNGW